MELNPAKVRPRDGWVVVLADPRKDRTESGIYLSPNESGVEKVTEGSGRILRAGPGEKNEKLGLKEGMRVLYRGFLKYANPIETDTKWGKGPFEGQKMTFFIMSSDDIMGIMPEGVEVGVFSGRPQVQEKR